MKRKQSFLLIAPTSNFGGPVICLPYDSYRNVTEDQCELEDEVAQNEPEKKPAVNWIRNAVARAKSLPAAIRIPRWRLRQRANRAGI